MRGASKPHPLREYFIRWHQKSKATGAVAIAMVALQSGRIYTNNVRLLLNTRGPMYDAGFKRPDAVTFFSAQSSTPFYTTAT
jgi:hypothetical protein